MDICTFIQINKVQKVFKNLKRMYHYSLFWGISSNLLITILKRKQPSFNPEKRRSSLEHDIQHISCAYNLELGI